MCIIAKPHLPAVAWSPSGQANDSILQGLTMQLKIKFVVTCVVLIATAHCIKPIAFGLSAISDSKDKQSDTDKITGFPSLVKGESSIESSDSQVPTESILDLGAQLCNTEVKIQWTIVNKSKQAIEWPRMTASCGCITGMPNSISLAVGESKQMDLKIKLPRNCEALTKQVTFWDANGNSRCQGIIKADVITPLKFEETRIEVASEERQWLSIPVTAINTSIDLRKTNIAALGAEVVGFEFRSEDGKKGLLRLDLDPAQTIPPSIKSSFMIEATHNGDFRGIQSLPIYFTTRTITQPNPVYFRRVGDAVQTQVRVWSFPLATELSKKSKFVVESASDASSKIASEFETKIEPATGTGPTCTVTLKCSKPKPGTNMAPTQLRLKCGEWEQLIDCKWE